MLRPRLDELLELRHTARSIGLASHHLVNSSFAGVYASVFRGQGLNFEEVREYRAGDDIRNMDWKVTARTGEAHLKVFREERERSVVLCIDLGPHMHFGTRGTFKLIQAARAAALLGWAANSMHDRVGGMVFGSESSDNIAFRPTKDRRALWRLLKTLTDAEPQSSPAEPEQLADALRRLSRGMGTGGLVFCIADFNRAWTGLESALTQLQQHHSVVLVPVDDPVDRELPDLGQAIFRSPDGELIEVDTSDPVGRENYRRRWAERRNALLSLCNRTNTICIPVATNRDVRQTLMTGLLAYSRGRTSL